MHVAFLCLRLPSSGESNGIVTYVRIMRDALRAAGHRVTILSGEGVEDGDGKVVPLPPARGLGFRIRQRLDPLGNRVGDGGGAVRIATWLRAIHARDPIDIFEVEESFGWGRRLRARGLPQAVLRLHGPHIYGRDELVTDAQRRLDAVRCHAEGLALRSGLPITSPSRRLLDETSAHYGFTPALAAVIQNPQPLAPAEEMWSYPGCDPDQMLCVGRFDLRKGADVVLRAFERALAGRPSLRLVLAGPDKGLAQPDGSLQDFATWTARHLRPETRARIDYRGNRTAAEIAALRRRSAFAVVGSRFETFAYTLAEAQATGMPAITSNSYSEVVEDGVTGLVVPIGDVAALADAMVALAADPDRLAAMGARARAHAEGALDPARVVEQTLAFYARALAAR